MLAAALTLQCASPSHAAAPSHAINWQTQGREVVCGITEVHGTAFDPGTGAPENGRWPGLQCSAPGIPRAPRGIGDPFVQLGQGVAGRARLVDLSQDDLISDEAFVPLRAGSTWSRYGIRCHVATNAIACANGFGHGFTLAPGHVRLH